MLVKEIYLVLCSKKFKLIIKKKLLADKAIKNFK